MLWKHNPSAEALGKQPSALQMMLLASARERRKNHQRIKNAGLNMSSAADFFECAFVSVRIGLLGKDSLSSPKTMTSGEEVNEHVELKKTQMSLMAQINRIKIWTHYLVNSGRSLLDCAECAVKERMTTLSKRIRDSANEAQKASKIRLIPIGHSNRKGASNRWMKVAAGTLAFVCSTLQPQIDVEKDFREAFRGNTTAQYEVNSTALAGSIVGADSGKPTKNWFETNEWLDSVSKSAELGKSFGEKMFDSGSADVKWVRHVEMAKTISGNLLRRYIGLHPNSLCLNIYGWNVIYG